MTCYFTKPIGGKHGSAGWLAGLAVYETCRTDNRRKTVSVVKLPTSAPLWATSCQVSTALENSRRSRIEVRPTALSLRGADVSQTFHYHARTFWSIFCAFGLKTTMHAPKLAFGGFGHPLTLSYKLEFQSFASCGHRPYTRNVPRSKDQSVQTLEWNKRKDGQD